MLCNETSGWQLWQHDPNRLIEGVEMPQQVRGVIAKAKGEPVSIETIVIPDPGPGEEPDRPDDREQQPPPVAGRRVRGQHQHEDEVEDEEEEDAKPSKK